MAIDAEQLNIILTAQTKGMRAELDRAQKRISGFEESAKKRLKATTSHFDSLANGIKILTPILTAAFSVQAFQGALQAAVEIDNLSNIAGVASDKFQILALTSQQFGVNQEKLSDILKDVNDKFGDYVQTGAGPLADFFTNIAPKVGLTAAAFADLSSDQKIGAYINALESANVSQADMTFYMEAIASDSTALVQAFSNNSEAILEMERRAAELGLVLDSETIAKAREAKQELDLMAQAMNINVTNAMIALGPLALSLAGHISAAAAAVAEFMQASGTGLATPVDTREALEDYSKFREEIDAVTAARNRLNAMEAQAEAGLAPTIPQLDLAYEELEAAEQALALARERAAVEDAARESAAATIQTIERETESLQAQAEANKLSAEEAERRRIATQRAAYEQQILNGISESGQELTAEARAEAEWLAMTWEQAAISASKILNPIEKTGTSVANVNEKLMQMGPLLQQLGFDADNLKSVANVVESSMEGAFMSIVDGTMTAKDAFRSMAAEIIKELYRVLVIQRLVGGFATATSAGSGILGAIGGAFGIKGQASGGYMRAGEPAVVGEHGRELFVPSTAGRVLSVPQSKAAVAGSGSSVVVNQNISFGAGVSRAEIQAMLPKIVESTKAAVFDAQRRSVNGMGY